MLSTMLEKTVIYSYALSQPISASIAIPTAQLTVLDEIKQAKLPEEDLYHLQAADAIKTDISHQMEQKTNDVEENIDINPEEKQAAFLAMADDIHQVYYGETSERVRKVQTLLSKYNYYTGDVDGIYGPLTDAAIESLFAESILVRKDIEEVNNDTELEPEQEQVAPKAEQSTDLNVAINQDIISTAKNFIGTPYVWGGTSPNGFDCSGFIQYVYQTHEQTIPRTTSEIWNFSTPVDQPSIGDLVFFETYQAGPSHVGIYLGNGNFIHTSTSQGVMISHLENDDYWQNRYLGAKRIK